MSTSRDGFTALMRASFTGKKDAVALLVERGANLDLQDKDGWTALMWARSVGRRDVAPLLSHRLVTLGSPENPSPEKKAPWQWQHLADKKLLKAKASVEWSAGHVHISFS